MRSRVGRLLLLVAAASALAACTAANDIEPTVELGPGVVVPASSIRPVDQCLHQRGFIATGVIEGRTGTNAKYGYSWTTPTTFVWKLPAGKAADALECRRAFAPYKALSEDEIAQVYDRWTKERLCLGDMGLDIPPPPSLDEFKQTWTTGPWTPGDTIRNPTQQMRDTCGLEMLD